MNGIEKITQRIDADVQTEIDGLLADAGEEAQRISAQYQAQADHLAASLEEQNQKDAAERRERLISLSQMEARKDMLAARQKLVDETFEQALEQLCALPDAQYLSVVTKLLCRAAPDGRGEVIFSEADRARIGQQAVDSANRALGDQGRLTLSAKTRCLRGGFILLSGRVEVNCSFETLVRLQKSAISGEVARCLFPKA